MRAVVLVGGFGTRLRPLTLDVPKQMLPIGRTTMLERVVGRLADAGIEEVVLSLGYRPDVFTAAFPDGECAGTRICYAVEPEPLDTGGAIAFAAREAGIADTFLALNGDVLTDMDLAELIGRHRQTGALGTIALTPVDDPSRYGVVPTDEDGRVIEFVEKPEPGTAPSNWINAGTYVLEPDVLDLIEPGRMVSIEREVFPALAAAGRLYAFQSNEYWIDAGTPEAYLQAHVDLLTGVRGADTVGIHPTAVVDPSAIVERSMVGARAQVGADATIIGSVVMDDVVVEPAATLRDTIVGARSRIGAATVLDGAVVGFGQRVEPGSTLVDVRVPSEEEWA
jgi:mannose-1-phosphate guanylyltransferase